MDIPHLKNYFEWSHFLCQYIITLTHTWFFHHKCVVACENRSDITVAEFLKNEEISFFDQSLHARMQEINH